MGYLKSSRSRKMQAVLCQIIANLGAAQTMEDGESQESIDEQPQLGFVYSAL